MKININKILIIVFLVAICVACFFIGRCSNKTESTIGKDLIDKIDDATEASNEIYERLIKAGCSIDAAHEQAKLVSHLMTTFSDYITKTEEELCVAARAAEENDEVIKSLIDVYKNTSNNNVLNLMVIKATQYEEIIEKYIDKEGNNDN